MADPLQTFSTSHLRRMQQAHSRADGYGRHRHLYLHATMRHLHAGLAQIRGGAPVTWLDYGCGKGAFMEEVRALGLFGTIAGYDPAVGQFAAQPEGPFDLVTCLDVIDVTEERFRPALIRTVGQLTRGVSLFDCITRHKPESPLRSHPPFFWTYQVTQEMRVLETRTEFPGMAGFERVVILAAPRGSEVALRFN